MAHKKPLLHSLHHFLIGGTLVLKGSIKISHHYFLGGLMILFGLIILAYGVYILVRKNESHTMHLVIHLFEGLVALFTAYIFFQEGATYLPYLFLLAAAGFFIAIYFSVRKHRRTPHH